MNLERPDLLLFANLAFIWIVANYFPLGEIDAKRLHRRTVIAVRPLLVFAGIGTVAGWKDAWHLAAAAAVIAAAVLVLRDRIARTLLAELELVNVGVLGALLTAIRGLSLTTHAIVSIDCAANAAPAVLLIGAIVCYAVRGGNYIVRGLLEKGKLIPANTLANGTRVQHGRLIGYLERIIVIAAVTAGSFEALAFLMAAKGLIRAKELEDRAFAEYFLVGSLCSALVALLAGMLVSMVAAAVPRAGWITLLA